MTKAVIADFAKKIRGRMAGNCQLYGEPIDLDDPDSVIVAAFLMGEGDERERHMRSNKLLRELKRM